MINFDFVISDPHAFHINICRGVSRWPDLNRCRDFPNEFIMTETIANNINSMVTTDDYLLCLGDWAFGRVENITKFRDMINCRNIGLIYGNHDKKIAKDIKLQKLFLFCERLATVRVGGITMETCHYAMKVWDNSHHGRILLYGHSHGTLPDDPNSLCMDAGMDTIYSSIPSHKKYFPYTPDEILQHMKTKTFKAIDHHNAQTS